jgi:hypothetical protein
LGGVAVASTVGDGGLPGLSADGGGLPAVSGEGGTGAGAAGAGLIGAGVIATSLAFGEDEVVVEICPARPLFDLFCFLLDLLEGDSTASMGPGSLSRALTPASAFVGAGGCIGRTGAGACVSALTSVDRFPLAK